MNIQSKRLHISLLLILTCFMTMSGFANTIDTGAVKFTGSIIYAPCSLLSSQSLVELSCLDSNRNAKIVNVNPLEIKNGRVPLTDNKGNIRFSWVNAEKKLGLIVVNYG